MRKVTYKQAGVDIDKASVFKGKIKSLVRRSFRPEVIADIGGFGSLFKLGKDKFREPVLVSSADGVGTKLKIAVLAGKHATVGVDLVAMNVNDILCTGAEPLFFLDYIAYSSLGPETLYDIVKGINDGCLQSGCSLIGGETAQMPGIYRGGEYDLAGFCVGVAERDNLIDGSAIKKGDTVIGLESSGLHSNGYSLVRKVLSVQEQKRMHAELLKPTRIYVKPLLALLKDAFLNPRMKNTERIVRGISNITGGAFYDKIARILPADLDARINKDSWGVPKIFKLIQNKGNVDDAEMFRTLNMGIGMVLVVEPAAAGDIASFLSAQGIKSWKIGEIVAGGRKVSVV
ncbi:MAG: phosphoribosylformylglycinamidine cyclo-ligase [Candidatus Omnitrophota bacterium]